jgi:hypothetical protein
MMRGPIADTFNIVGLAWPSLPVEKCVLGGACHVADDSGSVYGFRIRNVCQEKSLIKRDMATFDLWRSIKRINGI